MLSHAQVWAAIDGLAKRNGLSPSGLAKRAGLDPTTFNPSKRFATDGRPRWPSTESLSKILEATGEALGEFVANIKASPASADAPVTFRELPMAGLAEAGKPYDFDTAGAPSKASWKRLSFPDPAIKDLFALEISGSSLLPLYRDGDVIIVARDMPLRRGDRIVVKAKRQELAIWLLHHRTDTSMELANPADQTQITRIKHSELDWVARILWASQ